MKSTKELLKSLKSLKKSQVIILSFLLLLCILIGSIIPLFLDSNILFSTRTEREYRVNELSDEDLVSPISFNFIDEEKTEQKKKELVSSIYPYFSFSYAETLKYREKAESVVKMEFKDDPILLSVSEDIINHFLLNGIFDSNEITSSLRDGNDYICIEPNTITNSEQYLVSDIASLVTTDNLRFAVYDYITENYGESVYVQYNECALRVEDTLGANVHYDNIYTELQKENVVSNMEPVLVKVEKGDYILKTDTLVTEDALKKLSVLNNQRGTKITPSTLLPNLIISIFIVLIWFVYFFSSVPYSYRKAQYTSIMLTLIIITLCCGFVISWSLIRVGIVDIVSFLPFMIIAMIGTTITGSAALGFASTLVLAAFFALWPNANNYSLFLISSIVYLLCISFKKSRRRFDYILLCLKDSLIIVLISVFFSLLKHDNLFQTLFYALTFIINSVCSFIIYSILIPILEKLFNIPTHQMLRDLCYSNNATIQQLSMVAQGTYNHVKNVSELSYQAALAIGANQDLAMAGARYHDIGKINQPEYFIENQEENNVHANISTQLSSSIIKSHVRLGVEKAKSIGLPEEVIDIIAEHHGNDIIKYFYNEAIKNSDNALNVNKEDFQYDGNPPSTKESGIVMLADCVEAATRTIKKPTHSKYEKMINSIIAEKISHGQLDNSSLTMTDLKKIKEAFIPALIGRDHHRISYGKENE